MFNAASLPSLSSRYFSSIWLYGVDFISKFLQRLWNTDANVMKVSWTYCKVVWKSFGHIFSSTKYFEISGDGFIQQRKEAITQICFIEKIFLKTYSKFTGKHQRRSLSFDKVEGWSLSYGTIVNGCFWTYGDWI